MATYSTLICAPIMGKSMNQMILDIDKAREIGVDMVEIRLDYLSSFNPYQDIQILIKSCTMLTLFTYRPKWEGGEYEGDDSIRLDALKLAMELGANYIDVELQVAHEFISSLDEKTREKSKIIVSSHNYHATPSVEEIGDLMVPFIGLVMTEKGLISRLLCPKYGGYLTFGSLEEGIVSAPGQPTVKDLLDIYNLRDIGPDTKVLGLIGKPVSQSKSPLLFNKTFKSVGFDGVYVPFLVDDLAKFLAAYASADFAGFSCTMPYKEAALECCDEVDPIAKLIGAVNTIVRRPSDGKLIGYNTDYVGAISAIEDGLRGSDQNYHGSGSPLEGKLFVVIGAGGAGKALAYGAKAKGAKVVIANRTYERSRELAALVGGDAITLSQLETFCPEDGMILANTTSIGMHPKIEETPIPKHALSAYALVFDAVYTPKMTRLLLEAKESGAAVVTGVDMFIVQAYEQYERFTGLPAPKELFKEIVSKM
ncbi:bifunctional 3-dehydroquinate dehydratase/shikimate dehydrogenase, chloroplastic-like isoform X2 [Papaver somniferum]|uniref:bifunctional 3-dehydroquinate dehydratase/shikimate dehydrogenase, chloroplastic-like isoform X2 n=1 Tax=Papaver somniferum TaxID=3469 RepID=UPI000E6F8FCF|nr:bifunctional 3-dehydroquinate dehydratase/shikimate dehydrogenase, chloroplastic-like isoform X2 [Papaver somniferum]XP_026429385.1 bifunctional 3-dehydroquinate dehydratase/shikimate dehydrogenase, chloroplastic-like isoform X2 [Papaver somniferum]